MTEKLTNFNRNSLVVSNGAKGGNAGNVTEEIARIGAEAEEQSRNDNSEWQEADRDGQRAMEAAVRFSAETYASEVGGYNHRNHKKTAVSPKAIIAFGAREVQAFVEEQKKQTEIRVRNELHQIDTNPNHETSHPSS